MNHFLMRVCQGASIATILFAMASPHNTSTALALGVVGAACALLAISFKP